MGKYVVDFYCPSEKLAVELDGTGHFTPEGSKQDETRGEFIRGLKIRILRYENKEVYKNLEAVLEDIRSNFRD